MNTKSFVLFLTILFVSFPAGLSAETAKSRISAVTVYRDRAIVTRTATTQLAAGEQVLSFENLPAALLDQSLQASGRGVAGATILDVSAQNVFAEATSNQQVKDLETQIKDLQRQRRVLDDRGKVLEEQRAYVQRMLQASTTAGPAGTTGAAARPTLDEWQKLFAYSEETLGKINAEQQKLDMDREPLQAKQTALEQQLNQLRGARGRQSKTITIRLSLTTPGQLDVALQYAVPSAGWTPSYDARLRSADRAVELSYYGIVRNGTGEDWNNVVLTLSTARPNVGGGAPELRAWITDIARPAAPTPVPLAGRGGGGGGRGGAAAPAANQEFSQTRDGLFAADSLAKSEAGVLFADVEAGATSATFKIPVNVSVPGNNTTQKVAINVGRLAATLQYQSTPKMLEAAFLNANATNTSEYPLLAGPMNTFLDDTFVAASSLKTVMPGEKFDLALGVDDGIAVKRRLVNRFTDDTGLTSKTKRTTYEILVTITNNKKTVEQVAFKEPTPVSRDEKIVVKLLTPQEKDLGKEVTREEDGKLVWRISMKPGEKREFPLKLSIEHPIDLAVTGLE